MKRFFAILAIAFSFISFSSFAADDNQVSREALKSFNSSFKNASEVSWSVSENHYRADFIMNGQHIAAYYSSEGKMIGITRNISSLQLPITLQADLKKNYDSYWITDLFEVANDEGTYYYITLEDADTKMVLKSTSNSDWSSYKKQRKS